MFVYPKIFLLSSFYLLFTIGMFAQVPIANNPILELENSISNNGYQIGDVLRSSYYLEDDSTFIYYYFPSSQSSIYPSGLDWEREVIEYNYFTIKKRDIALNEISKIEAKKNHTIQKRYKNLLWMDTTFYREEGTLWLLGEGENEGFQSDTPWFIWEIDKDLNIVKELWVESVVDSILHVKSVTNRKSTERFIFQVQTVNGQFVTQNSFEITREGEVINSSIESYQNIGEWPISAARAGRIEMDNNHIITLPNRLEDSLLNLVCTMNLPSPINQLSGSILKLDSSHFLFGGTGFYQQGSSSNVFQYEVLLRGDFSCHVDTVFYKTFINDDPFTNIPSQVGKGRENIALALDSTIYFTTNRNGVYLASPTTLVHTSLKQNGEVNWSYSFGDPLNSYQSVNTIALPDGGSIIFIEKLIPVSGLFFFGKSNLDYVRFDKDGNVLTTSIPAEQLNIKSAQLYPNPVSNTLHIDCGPQLNNPSLKLFDSFGRLVRNESLRARQSQVDMSDLAGGVYVYQIWAEGKIVQVGKVVHL